MIERVRETLREAPMVAPDQRAVARLLSAVWASPSPSRWRRVFDAWRVPALSGLGAAAVAGVALLVGFVSRGSLTQHSPEGTMVVGGVETPVMLASNTTRDAGDAAAVLTQFVLDDQTARRVSLVGEFNDWEAGNTPLTRLASGLWTVTVPLLPGRHVYAFVLDDRLVVADPRAPKVVDADYGREGSVVMVFAR